MSAINSTSIGEQIADLDATVASLSAEADDLALPAVGGDKEAVVRLSELRAKIGQASADRIVLAKAKAAAERGEAKSAAKADHAARAQHIENARDQIAHILDCARQADDLVAKLRAVLVDIAETETRIARELRASGLSDLGARVGRRGLADVVVGNVQGVTDGTDKFRRQRTAFDVATAAWREFQEPANV
jgi:hypothetical protein